MIDSPKVLRRKGRKPLSEFAAFTLIGGISTLIDWSIFSLLFFVSTPYLLALIVSYSCGALVNFLGNRLFTFRSSDKRIARQIGIFTAIVVFNLILSLLVFSALISFGHLPPIAARMLTTVFIFFVNYAMHKYITFIPEFVPKK